MAASGNSVTADGIASDVRASWVCLWHTGAPLQAQQPFSCLPWCKAKNVGPQAPSDGITVTPKSSKSMFLPFFLSPLDQNQDEFIRILELGDKLGE